MRNRPGDPCSALSRLPEEASDCERLRTRDGEEESSKQVASQSKAMGFGTWIKWSTE